MQNPIIADALFMTAFLESWGTGVSCMVEACKAVGLPEPEYGTDGLFVWITFKRPNAVANLDTNLDTNSDTTLKTNQKLSKMQEDILAYLTINPAASRKELALHIGNSTEDGIKYNLDRLKKLGLIQREGAAKGGRWKIVNGDD